uniref:Uncharacterized protein n=1 Tax=Tanacetum cinerariifolium TaxID=118510 RepID=A0A699KV09_TANCI|nr:hypothetical protein [Tanacetum cinerariifolium]
MLDSLVRVSRRAVYNHYASILAEARTSPGTRRINMVYNTPPEGSYITKVLSGGPRRCWPATRRVNRSEDRRNTASKSGCKRFPFNNFTCFLTLFPKCFSSFDHSTCALSVSGQYLALEEIYLPFRAAFPNNSTRRRSYVEGALPVAYGILTLYDPEDLRRAADRVAQYQARLEWCNDARTGMPRGIPRGAMCVQRFDDSLNSAIHITYRISLRSSSMPEPRDPLLKVLIYFLNRLGRHVTQEFGLVHRGATRPEAGSPPRQHSRTTKGLRLALPPGRSPRGGFVSFNDPSAGESARRGETNTQHQARLEGTNDARTGMPHGIPRGAMCVQRFDDSLNSAIHTTYRISLRSSSMPEPRDPLLKVVTIKFFQTLIATASGFKLSSRRADPPRKRKVLKRHG